MKFVRYFDDVLDILKSRGGKAKPEEIVEYLAHKHKDYPVHKESSVMSTSHQLFHYLEKASLVTRKDDGLWHLTNEGNKTSLTDKSAREIYDRVNQMSSTRRREQFALTLARLRIESSLIEIREERRKTLLKQLLQVSPKGFERLCKIMLNQMGFEQVVLTDYSKDGGIDGHAILRLNPITSIRLCFQCKRYSDSIGVREMRDFRGAIFGRAERGIFITTGKFTNDAQRESVREGVTPIELIDREKLMEILEEYQIGIEKRTIEFYDLDLDFFKNLDGSE